MSELLALAAAFVAAESVGVTNFTQIGAQSASQEPDSDGSGIGRIGRPDAPGANLGLLADVLSSVGRLSGTVESIANRPVIAPPSTETVQITPDRTVQDYIDVVESFGDRPDRPDGSTDDRAGWIDLTDGIGPVVGTPEGRFRDNVYLTDEITLGSTVGDVVGADSWFRGDNPLWPQDGSIRRLLTTTPQDTAASGINRLGDYVFEPVTGRDDAISGPQLGLQDRVRNLVSTEPEPEGSTGSTGSTSSGSSSSSGSTSSGSSSSTSSLGGLAGSESYGSPSTSSTTLTGRDDPDEPVTPTRRQMDLFRGL